MPEDSSDSNRPEENFRPARRMQVIMSWVIVIILTPFGVYLLYHLAISDREFWTRLLEKQFPVLVALPMAGLGALFVTLILRISTGPLEFEVGAFKFKGGAAPIVFWIICFLVIVIAIKMLWQSDSGPVSGASSPKPEFLEPARII